MKPVAEADRAAYERELVERLADLLASAVREHEAQEADNKALPVDTAVTDIEMAQVNRARAYAQAVTP